MCTSDKRNYALILALVAIGLIFVLDLVTSGWAFWLLYPVPVLAASLFVRRESINYLSSLCSILIITGVFFTPSPIAREIAVTNRFLGIGVFWIIIILMMGRKSLLENLEDRIEERTADLNAEIAERKRTEIALKKSMAEMEKLNRDMESFSYSISHDLRTPLSFIRGYIEMILKDHGDDLDEEARIKFKLIQDSVNRMDQLVVGILALSRAERQELSCEHLDVSAIIESVISELLQTADQSHRPELIIKDLPPAQGDPVLIRQVFTNLLSNAIKFTRGRELPKIELGGYSAAGESIFYVRDNGAGFDMDYADRLFGLFQRLHGESEFEGTGVGLAIVQRVVQRHGGRVWAEGEVNKGATFYLSLPEKQ